jgi:hypothetical protein
VNAAMGDAERVGGRGPSCRVCGERRVEEFRLLGLRVDGSRVVARVDHWAGCRRLSETVWAIGPAPLDASSRVPAEDLPAKMNGASPPRTGLVAAPGVAGTGTAGPGNGRPRNLVVDGVRRSATPAAVERAPVAGDHRSPTAPGRRPGRIDPPRPAPAEAPAARSDDFSFNQTVESVRHAEPVGTGRPLADTLRRLSVAPILVDLRERSARRAHERAMTGEPQGDR